MMANEISVRWGDGRRADSDFAREQILDATVRCLQTSSFQQLRMEHIAREAKVSRQTIYRYFESREDLMFGVLLRELQTLLGKLQARVDQNASFADFMVETLAIANELIHDSMIIGLMVRESTTLMNRVYLSSTEISTFVGAYFQPSFDAAVKAGEIRNGIEFGDLIDWIMHIGSTYILLPSQRSASKEFRRMLRQFMIPSILREKAIAAIKQ